MKANFRPITWILVFVWFIFMGLTFVSFGLGTLYPPLNKIAQPFVCPNGHLSFIESLSNPMPGTTVTQIGWYCVDSNSGAATKMVDGRVHLYAGVFYGLLTFLVAVTLWYYYSKGIVWVQKFVRFLGVAAIILMILLPMMPLFGLLFPKSTPKPNAAATALDSTYKGLTSKTTSDFHSTDKPLPEWNGIPIMPQAISGAQTNSSVYTYKVSETSGAIESYYSDKLESQGWILADHRWQGMKFTKDERVLLVTFVPAVDMRSWVVTLTRIP